MDLEQLETSLLEVVNGPNYQPLKPRQLAKKLKLNQEEADALRKLVKKLVREGKLSYRDKHQVAPPSAAEGNRVTGLFRRTESGSGYVRPSHVTRRGDRSQDVYIPARSTSDAATGDIVLVKILGLRKGRDQAQGEVIEVVERDTHKFVGTYFETDLGGMVRVDGGLFDKPIAVGDPGAKGARVDDKVAFEMVRFPTHAHGGEGVIIEVLGQRGEPGVDTLSIIWEYDLPDEFAEDALEESRERAEKFNEQVENLPPERLDLTAETIITIDPVDARDFDDAISLVKLENGHWRLGVHIADVSYFVEPNTPLDREARGRATSVYLPDRVIPMLPEIISNSLASLQPDRVRFTKTCFIEFTAEGTFVACDLHNAAIKSSRRFTYEEVDDYLADRSRWKSKLTPEIFDLLGRMHELAMILRRRRFERGAIELSMRDVKIDLDKDGKVVGAHHVENTESHQIIEEFMLAANEAVATELTDREWPFLRRIHPPPDPRRVKNLEDFVRDLGFKVGSLESRFEVQTLLDAVHGEPTEPAINYAVLRSLSQAIYSPQQEGHYALATENYCHFTSPIRRYPDLTIHRLIDCLLEKRSPTDTIDTLFTTGEHCSERERRAEKAERELIKVKLLDYLRQHIGRRFEGVIVGVESFGLFVQCLEMPAEGLVHISTLADDYYHFDRDTHTLVGHRQGNLYRLGDPVIVEVAVVDVDKRELDFRLIGRGKPQKRKVTKPARGQKKKKASRASQAQTRSGKPAKEKPAKAKFVKKKATRKKAKRKGGKGKRKGKGMR